MSPGNQTSQSSPGHPHAPWTLRSIELHQSRIRFSVPSQDLPSASQPPGPCVPCPSAVLATELSCRAAGLISSNLSRSHSFEHSPSPVSPSCHCAQVGKGCFPPIREMLAAPEPMRIRLWLSRPHQGDGQGSGGSWNQDGHRWRHLPLASTRENGCPKAAARVIFLPIRDTHTLRYSTLRAGKRLSCYHDKLLHVAERSVLSLWIPSLVKPLPGKGPWGMVGRRGFPEGQAVSTQGCGDFLTGLGEAAAPSTPAPSRSSKALAPSGQGRASIRQFSSFSCALPGFSSLCRLADLAHALPP